MFMNDSIDGTLCSHCMLLFPRAFYHTLCEAESCLENLPHNEKPRKAVSRVKNKVMKAKPETLSQEDLHQFIDDLQLGLAGVHDVIAASYFSARREPQGALNRQTLG